MEAGKELSEHAEHDEEEREKSLNQTISMVLGGPARHSCRAGGVVGLRRSQVLDRFVPSPGQGERRPRPGQCGQPERPQLAQLRPDDVPRLVLGLGGREQARPWPSLKSASARTSTAAHSMAGHPHRDQPAFQARADLYAGVPSAPKNSWRPSSMPRPTPTTRPVRRQGPTRTATSARPRTCPLSGGALRT